MKKTLGFVGCFVGFFIGVFIGNAIAITICSIICCIVGILWGASVDEEERQERERQERRAKEEEDERLKRQAYILQRTTRLLRERQERERQERKRIETQREAEIKAAERKEELARQREVEEKRNLVNSLPACVVSWQSHSNSNLKHRYFYEYFSYDRYKNNATPTMWDTWHTVWDFKNDIGKNVSMSANAVARNKVVQLVESTICSTFGTKTKYLTLVCLAASTQNKTERRFREFSERVCGDLNMTNAYPHIRVVEDGNARHEGGDGIRTVQYDRWFFNDKYVILFDDVRTSGRSLEKERRHLESMGAKVICAITIAQTKNM